MQSDPTTGSGPHDLSDFASMKDEELGHALELLIARSLELTSESAELNQQIEALRALIEKRAS